MNLWYDWLQENSVIMKKIAGGKLKDFSFILYSISIPSVQTKMRPI